MGAENVINAAETMATALVKVSESLKAANAGLPDMSSGLSGLSAALEKINPEMRRLATSMSIIARSKRSLQGLFADVDRSIAGRAKQTADAAESAGGNAIIPIVERRRKRKSARDDRGVPLPEDTMPEEPKEKKGRTASQSGFKPGYFMLRYMAMSKAIDATAYLGTGILMGNAREKIASANMDLTAIDFDKVDRKRAELEGIKFSRQLPTISSDQYMKATSQTGSSLDVNETGFSNLNKVTQTALKLGQLTKIKDPEKAIDLVMGQLNAVVSKMTPSERASKLSASSDWLPNKAAEIAGQMNAAIRIFPTWGKNIQDFMAMGLGTMTSKGWDLPRQLAFLGSLQSPGFKATTIGRSARTILGKEARTVARLQMLDKDFTEFGDKKGKAREEALTQKWLGEMQANPDVGQLKAAQAYENAKKFYTDPMEKVGASRDFRSIIEFFFNKEFQQFMNEKRAIIEEEGRGGESKLDKQLADNVKDITTPYQHVANELNNLATAVSASKQSWEMATAAVSLFAKITDSVNKGNMVSAAKDDLITKFGGAKTAEEFEAYKKAKAEVAKKMRAQGSSDREIQTVMAEADWQVLRNKEVTVPNRAATEMKGRIQSVFDAVNWFGAKTGGDPWKKFTPEQLGRFMPKDRSTEEIDDLIRGDQVSLKPQAEAFPLNFGGIQSAEQILSAFFQQSLNQGDSMEGPARNLNEAAGDLKQVAAILSRAPQPPAPMPSQTPVVPGQINTSGSVPGQGFLP